MRLMFRMVYLTMNAFLRHLQRVRSLRGQSVAGSISCANDDESLIEEISPASR